MCRTEAIMLTRKEATQTVHFLNRFINGMSAVTPEFEELEKIFVFNLIQRILPHCDFEEGEEKLIVSSQEKLEGFLQKSEVEKLDTKNYATEEELDERFLLESHHIYKARELARKGFVLGVVNIICLVVAIVLMIIRL